jgi:hypothetical protein
MACLPAVQEAIQVFVHDLEHKLEQNCVRYVFQALEQLLAPGMERQFVAHPSVHKAVPT